MVTCSFCNKVPAENEFEEIDKTCPHWLLISNQNARKIHCGTVRLIEKSPGIGKLGRLAVLKEYRGKGNGKLLVKAVEEYARKIGMKKIKIHAQLYTLSFYEKCGFLKESEEVFMEENIPHVYMVLEL